MAPGGRSGAAQSGPAGRPHARRIVWRFVRVESYDAVLAGLLCA
jgi:hypothetical protein